MNGDGSLISEPDSGAFSGINFNDVWRTASQAYVASTASKNTAEVEIARANLASELAKGSRTMASPGGFLGQYQSGNPLPGLWSPFPQAQTKPAPGGDMMSSLPISPGLIFWGIVLVVGYFALGALLGKRRK